MKNARPSTRTEGKCGVTATRMAWAVIRASAIAGYVLIGGLLLGLGEVFRVAADFTSFVTDTTRVLYREELKAALRERTPPDGRPLLERVRFGKGR